MVSGVTATRVHDQAFLNGSRIEDTYDLYAQDADGNVWYLGEDTKQIQNGVVVGTEGTWEWGVDGALPGIIMWSDPAAYQGRDYRQEYYPDNAEDWGRVDSLGQSVAVPAGSFTGCITTTEWNGLEANSQEAKSYCSGVGLVLTVAGSDREELVSKTP